RARLAGPSRRVGVPAHRAGRLRRVRRFRHAPLLRRPLASGRRLVARLVRAGAPGGSGRPGARARPSLSRPRRQRGAAPRARSRSARGVCDLGCRPWDDRRPPRRLRHRGGPREDPPGRAAKVSGRSARVGRLSLRPSGRRALVLLGTAFFLGLAFPRTDWEGIVWVGLMPLIVDALRQSVRHAFAWGWAFGTVFYLVLLRWLDFTFNTYSEIPWPLTWGPVLALAAYCALYTG